MKNEMIETIEQHGIDFTAKMLSEYVNKKIQSEEVAVQFILEEIEAASHGNEMAKIFASSSGFDEEDYNGAMGNSFEEVDGVNGPQQKLLNLCMMLYPNQDLMAELRIKTVDYIMQKWLLGKYSSGNSINLIYTVKKKENHKLGVFANIMNDLGEYAKEFGELDSTSSPYRFMAYVYARRAAAAGLYLQGYWERESYNHASSFFKSTQLTTGQTKEFQEEAAYQSGELLLSYSSRLTKNVISKITTIVELNQAENLHKDKTTYTYDELLDFLEDVKLTFENGKLILKKTLEDYDLTTHKDITIIGDLIWEKGSRKMNWYEAMEYAKNLRLGGYDDWRLPTLEELSEVVTLCGGIAVWGGEENWKNIVVKNNTNETYQFNCKRKSFTSYYYWSSTSYANNSGYAWVVDFYGGYTIGYNKSYQSYVNEVRCVR